jgi:hypothetical protein
MRRRPPTSPTSRECSKAMPTNLTSPSKRGTSSWSWRLAGPMPAASVFRFAVVVDSSVLRRQRPAPSRVRRLPRACWEAVCRRNRNPRKEPFTRSRSRATSEEIRQHARSYLPRIRNFETKVLAQEPSRESLRLLASNLELPLDLPHPWSSRHRQQCYGKRDSPNGDREKELALRRSP